MQDLPNSQEQQTSDVTLRDQLQFYLRYWPAYIIFAVIGLSIGFIYLRYTTPQYSTVATILIKKEDKGGLAEIAAFQQAGLSGGGQTDLGNEIQILKSKNLTEKVVAALDLNIRYFVEGNIKDEEIFKDRPFTVTITKYPDTLTNTYSSQQPLYISPISSTEFYLQEGENGEKNKYYFGKVIDLTQLSVLVTPNPNILTLKGKALERTITVNFGSVFNTVAYYRSAIQISQDKSGSIIQLGTTSPVRDKAETVIDELIKQYNLDAVADQNLISQNTADFIENRLLIISNELDTVETGKVDYKRDNKVTDIEAESGIFLSNASASNNRLLQVETQLSLVNTMIENLQRSSATDLLPANLGFDNGVPELINNYNTIVLERNRLLRSATEDNPLVVTMTTQLQGLKSNILQSMQNARTALRISRNDLRSQEAQIGSEISKIPAKEKQIRSITRQQQIKEELYIFLLKKREETSISLAVTTPKAKIVDYAYSSASPVSPNKQMILLGAFAVGLVLPILFLYVKQLLDNKIRSKAYIEGKSKEVPVVGEIPMLTKTDEELIQKNDRSVLAEAFRILRTNLQYLFVSSVNGEGTEKGKTIFVTSTVKGEGKTFIATNLALTLANAGNKVLLIGGDIRNPQLQRYTTDQQRNKEGLVEYLISKDSTLNEYLISSELNENLSFILSGIIPPNPAELWLQPRVAELFKEARMGFDYVVVDTAPSMLVTDTFLITKFADVMLYVLRAGYTEKRLLDFPLDNIKSGKLKNASFVLNNVSMANFGYGNKYGYSYGEEKKTTFDKIKEKFKR